MNVSERTQLLKVHMSTIDFKRDVMVFKWGAVPFFLSSPTHVKDETPCTTQSALCPALSTAQKRNTIADGYETHDAKTQVTFLSKKSARDSVSYADGDGYSLGGGKSCSGDGVKLIRESSDILNFPTLPLDTSQQTQDSRLYAEN